MKKYLIISIVTILAAIQVAQAQSLDDYLIEAAENNPGLKASYLQFEAALEKTAQVKALPDLSLSFGYFISPIETRVGPQQAKFSLVQMFPWFGTNNAKSAATELQAQAQFYQFQDQKNELYYRVSKAYYPLLELNKHILWQEENLKILNTYKRLSTSNFSNGKGTMVDVIRVDIMIDNSNTEIELLKAKIKPLEAVFNRLLNRSDTAKIVIVDLSEISTTTHYSTDSIILNNPKLKAIEQNKQAAAAFEQVAVKQGAPTFGIGLDYAIVGQRTDVDIPNNGKDVLMPMVTMSLPLFRKKYNASVQEAQFMQEALDLRKIEITNNLISSYEIESYNMVKAVQQLDLYNQQIKKTKQAIELLYSNYANSGKEFEEVLRMEQQLLKYNISKATASMEYFIARARLDYLTSKSI